MSAAAAIFVKTPGLSAVKTRLARDIGAAAAAEFHRRSATAVAAVVEAARSSRSTITPYWAVAEREAFERALWNGFASLWQGEGGLGERLEQVHTALQARHDFVLLLGADAPQLSAGQLLEALRVLQLPRTPFVLGPASDGGFWLFGSRQAVAPATWRSVRYSQRGTARELLTALEAAGRTATLPLMTDVDCAHDLHAVLGELRRLSSPLPEQRSLASWIDELIAKRATPRPTSPKSTSA